MAEELVVLRGGSRDGESTSLEDGVTRLLAASEAPGLLDIYEDSGRTEHLRGNTERARVFTYVGQDSAEGVAPELLHPPQSDR